MIQLTQGWSPCFHIHIQHRWVIGNGSPTSIGWHWLGFRRLNRPWLQLLWQGHLTWTNLAWMTSPLVEGGWPIWLLIGCDWTKGVEAHSGFSSKSCTYVYVAYSCILQVVYFLLDSWGCTDLLWIFPKRKAWVLIKTDGRSIQARRLDDQSHQLCKLSTATHTVGVNYPE